MGSSRPSELKVWEVEMSIGNRNFGIPKRYRYRVGIRIFKPGFFGILSVSEIQKVNFARLKVNFSLFDADFVPFKKKC